MASAEERLKILGLIQEGKISAEEGVRLLAALESGRPRPPQGPPAPPPAAKGPGARWLRVRVTDTNTGKVRVNIRMPVNVLQTGIKMGARFAPQVEGLEMNQLMDFVRSGEIGQVVDVYDEDDGEHVEVFLE